jgi:hypothetical protein
MQDLTSDRIGPIVPWPQLTPTQKQVAKLGLVRLAITTWTNELVENRYRLGKISITVTPKGYRLWGRLPEGTFRLLLEVVTEGDKTLLKQWVGGIQWRAVKEPRVTQLPT